MIEYIKYSVDGKTYSLVSNEDGTWTRDETAPSVAGNYLLTIIVSENGIVTTIDNSNSLYETYLDVIVETERVAFIQNYIPPFIAGSKVYMEIFNSENEEFDDLYAKIAKAKSDMFIETASEDMIERLEKFMKIIGAGTLEQRKSFILAKKQKGKKLNERTIKNAVAAITGSDCLVTFFGSDEADNPYTGYGHLRVRVLSPDSTKDYRYADIERSISPSVPEHIKLGVVRYFATWEDIMNNFAEWSVVAAANNWQAINDYIPPLGV